MITLSSVNPLLQRHPRLPLLLLMALPLVAHAQFEYAITNNAITITGYTGQGGAVTIPAFVNRLPVTAIGDSAFAWSDSLTSVTIPDSVTSIGDEAFQECMGLTNVTLGIGVASIGNMAFEWCGSLQSILVPVQNSFYSSVDGVLFDQAQTTLLQFPPGQSGNYTIPNGVANIGTDAFYDCFDLRSVTIPGSVTTIQDEAFYDCMGLSIVCFQGNPPGLGTAVFGDDTYLTVYYLPTTSGWGTNFGGCPTVLAQLNYITNNGTLTITGGTIPPGGMTIPGTINGLAVTSIAERAFNFDESLTSLTISNGVTSIGDGAFDYCVSLTNVTIPGSVTNIGDYAFGDCFSLANFTVPAANSVYSSVGGNLFNKNQTALIQYAYGQTAGSYAIPNGVTTIEDGAFEDDYTLTNILIPNSVTTIGDYAFAYCSSLLAITVAPANAAYSDVGGVLFDKKQTTLIQYPEGLLGGYTIPTGVTTIATNAFSDCNLTSVAIPGSVTALEDDAFFGCYWLTNVVIANGLNSLGESVFQYCWNLTSLTLPNSVTTIGNYALADNSLGSLTVGSGVSSLGAYALANNSDLTNIYCLGNVPSFDPTAISGDNLSRITVYYLPGTTGWSRLAAYGLRVAPWYLPSPLILINGPGFGVQTNAFCFTISWATNASVVVEACTNLGASGWQPVQTNTLTGGSVWFSDPQWMHYQNRFYRLVSAP
jgi:hypothetical protein